MTEERMALSGMLEKGSDRDLLREMIGIVVQQSPDCRRWRITGRV